MIKNQMAFPWNRGIILFEEEQEDSSNLRGVDSI